MRFVGVFRARVSYKNPKNWDFFTYQVQSAKKSQFFGGFVGNSRSQNPNKLHIKQVNITGV